MNDKTPFAQRFGQIQANLEEAVGDKQTAWLATLSIVSGMPLLIDSKTSQEKLARAVASVISGSCESLGFGFQPLSSNVLYMGNLDNCYCLPAGCLRLASQAVGTPPNKNESVVVLIGHISPPHSRKSMASAGLIDQFACFSTVEFDGESVSRAQAAVTLNDVADMRKYVRDNVVLDDEAVQFILRINKAATPSPSDDIPDELNEYVADGPASRTWVHLAELSRVVAASQGRTVVSRSDVLALVEPVLSHRYRNDTVSPYNRFDLGRRIAGAVLTKLKAA